MFRCQKCEKQMLKASESPINSRTASIAAIELHEYSGWFKSTCWLLILMILLCVFLQYCNGGDLADYLQGKRGSNLKLTLRLFIMIKLLVLQERWQVQECLHIIARVNSERLCLARASMNGSACCGQRALTVQSLSSLCTVFHGVAFSIRYNLSRGTSLKAPRHYRMDAGTVYACLVYFIVFVTDRLIHFLDTLLCIPSNKGACFYC